MILTLKSKVNNFFSKGHERSQKIKKNIAGTFIIKFGSIAAGLILIPMTINYVNQVRYGIFLTLSSIINWFNFFDIGLGNGLKNKLAQKLALNDIKNAQQYVSTTYFILFLISCLIFLIFLVINHFLQWNRILNVDNTYAKELTNLTIIVFGFFCIQFITQLINPVLMAMQKPAFVSLINFFGQLLALIIIFILTKITITGNLLYITLAIIGCPIFVQLIASIWLYASRFKHLAPSIKNINLKLSKDLYQIGGKFFIIQVGAIVLYQTDNIVISQVLGPQEVTPFNAAYKIFSVILMVFVIIATPFWSALTEAYTKKDFSWIKHVFSRMQKYWLMSSATTIILVIISPFIYKLWLGNTMHIHFLLSIAMGLYIIGYTWMILLSYFLSGIGKVNTLLYLYIGSTIVNIPISILLARLIGVAGVTFSNVLVLVVMGIALYFQLRKIILSESTVIVSSQVNAEQN